ncbi:MAG: type II secretion system protein [Deltaproteobacteria bacterium]|nr:type II secretion system protein [Deltaproteobacteria bacterium]
MRRCTQKGFTLIELVLMMVLLGILSAVAIATLPNLGIAKVEAAATKVQADLMYVRQLARNRNGTYGIIFDTVNNQYTVFLFNPGTNTKTTLTDPLTLASMVTDFKKIQGLKGVTLQSTSIGGTSEVRFTPQGIPQNGSGTPLGLSGSVVVQEAGASRTITIQSGTGEVTHS